MKKYLPSIRAGLIRITLCLCALLTFQGGVGQAITQQDVSDINNGYPWYDPNFGECSTAASVDASDAISTKKAQEDNAKIVMGIAKSYSIGQKGALIGLMVGLAESGLKNYASKSIPVSQENPAWLALPEPRPIGNDHDSVGIMQQRVSTGWSTFGNGTSKEIVWQLMTPAYAAQAFFGTPPGADLPSGLKQPSALKKGLQNLDNWQSLDPWIAAQKVQISAFDDGRNYKAKMADAQALLDKFWSSAPAIELPIPITGGQAPTGDTASSCASSVTGGNVADTILAYAWPDYHEADYLKMKPEYEAAVDQAQKKGVYVGGGAHPGIDCGGFVGLVMRNSGADPTYNPNKTNVVGQYAYVKKHPEKFELAPNIKSTSDFKQGEFYINFAADLGHTYIYVGKLPNFNGNSASASYLSWRTPMASSAYDLSSSKWYRVIGATGGQSAEQ